MKRHIIYIFAALAFSAASCSVKETAPEVESSEPETLLPTPKIVDGCFAGQAIIEFDDDMIALIESDLEAGLVETKSPALNAVLQDLGIVSLERVFPDAGEFEARSRAAGMHRFYQVTFSEDLPVTKAVGELSDLPGIVSADPVRPVYKRAVFNDPNLSKQWHYNGSNAAAHINVEKVWTDYTTGDNHVIVCVVDEPVDPTHPDLKGNLWKDSNGHTGYNFARSSYDLTIRPENGDGDIGHGTHVAGTVAAVNNNGIGVCGVAGGNAAQGVQGALLQSCAIFSGTQYASDAQTCKAIKWGADHGAVISQNSWGFYADADNDGKVSSSELASFKSQKIDAATKAAIDYFIKNAGCDSDGNQAPDSPMKGGLVIFAAGNENIDYDIISVYEPVIAVGAIQQTGTKATYSNYGSWVDIAAPGGAGTSSGNSVWSTLPKNVEDGATGYGGAGWAGTSMACPHVSGVAALIISYFGKPGFTNDDAKKILFGGLGSTVGGSTPIGKKIDALASFEWALANGYTPAGSSEEQLPPVITFDVTQFSVHAHETVTVPFRVSDPNQNSFTLTLDPGSKAASIAQDESGAWFLTVVGRDDEPGKYTAVITAEDETGLSSSQAIEYTLLENHAPKPSQQVITRYFDGPNRSFDFFCDDLFTDEDGESLSEFSFTLVGDKVVSLFPSKTEGKLHIITDKPGFCQIDVTVKDALGAKGTVPIQIFVKNPDKEEVYSYPNPVTDVLNVRIDRQKASPRIEVLNSAGGKVYEEEVSNASCFEPMAVKLGHLAPGRYVLRVTCDGKTASRSFVKI